MQRIIYIVCYQFWQRIFILHMNSISMDDIIIGGANISDIICKNVKIIFIVLTVLFITIVIIIKKSRKIPDSLYEKQRKIIEIKKFLSDKKCDELINMGLTKFKPSKVESATGPTINTSIRTSSNVYFAPGENKLIQNIELKVAKICNVNISQLEPMQLGRYTKGQEYKYHHDYFSKESNQSDNQRIKTFLLYLNTLKKADGGETDFLHLNKSFIPTKGKAVIWNNKLDGIENDQCMHSGKPIKTDSTKYIMTIWIREKKYRA